MPKSWSDKRERQYEHIKQGYEQRGTSEARAEEIAARTVNKERSAEGETREAKAGVKAGGKPSVSSQRQGNTAAKRSRKG